MAKQRQTTVNIDYKVNTVDVERGNSLLLRASKSTDELRRASENYSKQAGNAYRFTSKTIEGMSIEVARLKQQVKLASTQNVADIQRLSAQYRSAKAQLDAYNKSLLETSRNSKQTASAAQNMASQFGEVYTAIRAIIAAGLAKELISVTLEMAKLSGTVEGVERAFNRLPNAELLLHSLRQATHGTVNDLELMQKALRASNFKIPLEQLGVLLEFATVKAQQTGQEVNHLVEYIVSGIGYRSIKRLDDLGFTANRVKEALGGVSLQAASMAEIMDAVTKLMNEDLEQTGGYAETAATHVDRLSRKLHDLRVLLSQKLENSWILEFYEAILDGARDLVDAFPTKQFKDLFSLTSLNPLMFMGKITDIIGYWQLGLEDVARKNAIIKNATEEAARVQKRLVDLETKERIPKIQEEIDKKEKVLDNYFYELRALEMVGEKYSEQAVALRLNSQEIEHTIKLLKDYKKAQEDILNAPPDGPDGDPRGAPKPLKQVVDIRFRNPITGAISKENFGKVMQDFAMQGQEIVDAIQPLQLPITPFILLTEWEKAFDENKEALKNLASGVIMDQVDSILFAEVDAYNARIDAARAFYDEQIALAGDNERAKMELRIKEEREIKKLEQGRADAEKKAVLASIRANTALGVIKVFAGGGTFADKIIRAAIVAAEGASQYLVASRQRYYAKGEINIKGPGTKTSDSIPAMLSAGESVMTADETQSSMGIFKAVRAKKLNDKVLKDIVSGRSGGSTAIGFDDTNLLKKLDEVKNAQPDILQRANLAYEVRKKGDNYKQIIRSKSLRS